MDVQPITQIYAERQNEIYAAKRIKEYFLCKAILLQTQNVSSRLTYQVKQKKNIIGRKPEYKTVNFI